MPKYRFGDSQECVSEGEYVLVVIGAEPAYSKNDNEMIELRFRIEQAPRAPLVYDRLVFTEGAEWRIDVFLKAIGRRYAVNEEVDFDEEFCHKLVGERTWAHLAIDVYKERRKNVVGEYLIGKSLPPPPVVLDDVKTPEEKEEIPF